MTTKKFRLNYVIPASFWSTIVSDRDFADVVNKHRIIENGQRYGQLIYNTFFTVHRNPPFPRLFYTPHEIEVSKIIANIYDNGDICEATNTISFPCLERDILRAWLKGELLGFPYPCNPEERLTVPLCQRLEAGICGETGKLLF